MYIRPPRGEYAPVDYLHVRAGPVLRGLRALVGALTWPLVVPMALASRRSMVVFQTCSELLAMAPFAIGIVLRYEFYRFALRRCGRNVLIGFGTVFNYPDVTIGDNVLIGRYNVIHHCDFGDYALTSERCTFLSGSRQHNTARTDVPMYLQGGQLTHIRVGNDVWVGAHCVVMNDVGDGSIVGAGAVVVQAVPEYSIALGCPARSRPRVTREAQVPT